MNIRYDGNLHIEMEDGEDVYHMSGNNIFEFKKRYMEYISQIFDDTIIEAIKHNNLLKVSD